MSFKKLSLSASYFNQNTYILRKNNDSDYINIKRDPFLRAGWVIRRELTILMHLKGIERKDENIKNEIWK